MLKRIFVLVVFFVVLAFPRTIYSQGEFNVDVNVDYSVQANGITKVAHTVSLENLFSSLYATSYVLNLENIHPINPQAFSEGKALELTQSEVSGKTQLKIHFDDAVVGKGKKNTFSISYTEDGFAIRTGEVWEISIPRLSDNSSFNSYNVNLIVPTSFGNEAYISPNPNSKKRDGESIIYSFNKERVSKTGIVAGFGEFQIFSFTLNYHLENPLNRRARVEVAMPPDTAYQRVYYQDLNIKPDSISLDEDNNWIANYILKSRERLDLTLSGLVQIFSGSRPFLIPTNETLINNLQSGEYWQVDDPQIRSLANNLGTARAIYDYVSTNLSYDYDRVRPNVDRKGATQALSSPNNSICMEFTDLFIALSRAAGIPAREVNGFAYTENPEIQPLSLVADVLHSWPEYWDKNRKVWVPIDPTWASTTGGVDYFNKLDLRHFTFVNHGISPITPYPPGSYKLGSNPQKDVFVNFGQLPLERTSKTEITAFVGKTIPFFGSKAKIAIYNPGPVAIYDLSSQVYFDNLLENTNEIGFLAPFSKSEFEVMIPFSFLGTKTPSVIKITAADATLEIDAHKELVLIYNLLTIFIIVGIVIIAVLIRLKKITVKPLIDKIRQSAKDAKKQIKEDSFQQDNLKQNS